MVRSIFPILTSVKPLCSVPFYRGRMRLLRILPLCLLLAMTVTSTVTVVHAQTTSISYLYYPGTVELSAGSGMVRFTVTYSAPSYGSYALVAAVWDKSGNTFAEGSLVSSDPSNCQMPSEYPWAAACSMNVNGDGVLDVTFQVTLNAAEYDNFYAASVLTTSSNPIDSSLTLDPFTINVTNTVVLSVTVPSEVPLSVDEIPQGLGGFFSLTLSPGTHLLSVPSAVNLTPGSRLKFDYWSDGSSNATRAIDLQLDTSIQAKFVKQYNLTLISSEASPTGAGWYNAGSSASYSAPTTYPMTGVLGSLGGKWTFNGWYEGQNETSASAYGSITIDTSHTLTAAWAADYTEPYLILGVVVIAIVVGAFMLTRARRKYESTEATSKEKENHAPDTKLV